MIAPITRFRFCSKHTKPRPQPLPCKFCEMIAQKPAQAQTPEIVAEPAQTPAITVIPPHKADAKPVPRSAISPEVRKKIEESLASAPKTKDAIAIVSEQVETSKGLKTLSAREDGVLDADDAAEKTDKTRKKNTRLPAQPKKQPTKQPGYLKSVTHSVIRLLNEDGTLKSYGRDENDRPIVPGRSDQELAISLRDKEFLQPGHAAQEPPSGSRPCGDCGQDLCKHCHPENVAQVHELLRPRTNRVDSETSPESNLEENLRRQFGIPPVSTPVLTAPRPTFKFHFYPEILSKTRKQLLELFDAVVDTEVETQKLLETRLKSTEFVQHEITKLNKRASKTIAHANRRLRCIPLLVKHSEDRIKSWSARVMKYGTKTIPPRAPDNFLDEKTREKYKYKEKKKLKKYQQWKTRLQTIIRETQAESDHLQQRLDNWGSSPDDFESVTVTINRDITFQEKFREPDQPINDLSESYAKLRELGATNTEAYISLLSTNYQMLAELSRSHPSLRPWRWFENEIVLQAIGYGLIRPTRKEFETYPQLKKYLSQGASLADEDTEIDHSEEERWILKTGGAGIGASILNFGVTRKGQPRMSGSFDNAIAHSKSRGPAAQEQASSSGWAGDIDSGEYVEDATSE
jgi:hypothetical protein